MLVDDAGDHAHQVVGATARRVGHDHFDRTLRILRLRQRRTARRQERRGEELFDHGHPPRYRRGDGSIGKIPPSASFRFLTSPGPMDELLYEVRDGVGYVTFNRPQARNALTFAMYERLAEICNEAGEKRSSANSV